MLLVGYDVSNSPVMCLDKELSEHTSNNSQTDYYMI
jgi:hypothetical protein